MSLAASAQLTRIRLSLALLTERRVALFATMDGFFVFAGLSMALASDGSGRRFWFPMFLLPALLLGVPMMADAVAVERRSGTLDLALTSPGVRLYFERRVASVSALIIAQGWAGMLLARSVTPAFPLSGPALQIVISTCFITAVTLNWAVRLKTVGAVAFATYATAFAFAPWLFSNPVFPPTEMNGPMKAADYFEYFANNLVLAAAALLFYLYALQRLSRPETIIQ
ncbi:MAG TPA: hypothetical protein VJZ00_25335 [Thermoanaerobaculia bacterium]|nr:hypothetical protein [Thermoanaerobaculia bacterium]